MKYILAITLLTYIGMIFFTKHRTSISFIGAGLLLIIGGFTGVFNAQQAFMKFPGDIVILIMVLSLFTDIFERLGVINYIGYKFISLSKENKIMIMITLPILMCITSLFMNNLTVVLLFTYMSLYLCIEYRLPIIPVLVSVIIGSNIGGAALPWADTPAVVITLYSNFNLIDFLTKLFVPCVVYSFMLSIYTYIWYKYLSPHDRYLPFREKPELNVKKIKFPIIIFILYIVSVSIAPFVNISIAFTSLLFGGIALISDGRDPMDILNNLPIMDSLAFIIALFIMGGVLEYCGILTTVANYVIGFTNQNPTLITLAVLLIAFTIATFLSAGPASATLIPICATLSPLVPGKLIYAALALGILAGSSMLPWSATGGPILLSQTNKFLKEVKVDKDDRERINKIYNLKQYIMFSIPFSLIMLIASAIYLTIAIKII
ncbi:MAG: SLC13 family permease [Paraclostridium sp.]